VSERGGEGERKREIKKERGRKRGGKEREGMRVVQVFFDFTLLLSFSSLFANEEDRKNNI